MFGITKAQAGHTAMALGTGLAVFAGEASRVSGNPWVDAGCYAAIATLAALGVGIAKRSVAPTP